MICLGESMMTSILMYITSDANLLRKPQQLRSLQLSSHVYLRFILSGSVLYPFASNDISAYSPITRTSSSTMPAPTSFTDPRAYHVLSYGTFLGTTIFQSFIGGVVAFKVLPRPMFSRLQQATFPVFFTMQTVLPLIMIATYPGGKLVQVGGQQMRTDTGMSGVLAENNRWTVLIPLATILITSAINMVAVGPATTKAMKDRHHQGTDSMSSIKPVLR